MAFVSPNYVQGSYSVAERDAIFDKAKLYPDPAGALQNQVPTIMPDGSIAWRQQSSGGESGTANANIAFVEDTQYASNLYRAGDFLIYNGQMYCVTSLINRGDEIIPNGNVVPTRVDLSFLSARGKGKNLGFNWFWIGGGSQAGNGAFPINQRGATTYTGAGKIFDGWEQTGGTTQLYDDYIAHFAPANESSSLIQQIDSAIANSSSAGVRQLYNDIYTFSALIWTATGSQNGWDIVHGSIWLSSTESIFYQNSDFALIAKATPGKIQLKIQVNASCSVTLGGIKFEQGSISTFAAKYQNTVILLDPPPDYGEELRKCQRYYFRKHFAAYETIGFGVVVGSWNVVGFDVGLGAQLASDSPTVSISDLSSLTASVPAAFSVTSSTTLQAKACGAMAKVQLENVNATTPGACYFYSTNADGLDIEFSAEP